MKKKKKKKPKSKPIDPKHLAWLIDNRDATQRVSVKLFRLLKEHPKELKGADFASPAQMLVAISFSLWRSVFLSDKTIYRKDTNKGAFDFLGVMLLTNAIAFSQEMTNKDWTFNYYAGNARYRLRELADMWGQEVKLRPLLPPKGRQTPKNRWKFLQNAFEKAVDHFEERLIAGKT